MAQEAPDKKQPLEPPDKVALDDELTDQVPDQDEPEDPPAKEQPLEPLIVSDDSEQTPDRPEEVARVIGTSGTDGGLPSASTVTFADEHADKVASDSGQVASDSAEPDANQNVEPVSDSPETAEASPETAGSAESDANLVVPFAAADIGGGTTGLPNVPMQTENDTAVSEREVSEEKEDIDAKIDPLLERIGTPKHSQQEAFDEESDDQDEEEMDDENNNKNSRLRGECCGKYGSCAACRGGAEQEQSAEEDLYSTVADAVAKLLPDMRNTGTEPSRKAKSLLLASAQPVTEWTDFDKRAAIKMQSLIRGHLVRAIRRRAREGQGDKGSNGLDSDCEAPDVELGRNAPVGVASRVEATEGLVLYAERIGQCSRVFQQGIREQLQRLSAEASTDNNSRPKTSKPPGGLDEIGFTTSVRSLAEEIQCPVTDPQAKQLYVALQVVPVELAGFLNVGLLLSAEMQQRKKTAEKETAAKAPASGLKWHEIGSTPPEEELGAEELKLDYASGLMWVSIGDQRPTTGVEMTLDQQPHQKLSRALQGKTFFDQKEWRAFGFHSGVSLENYIKSGAEFFRPTGLAHAMQNPNGRKWRKVGDTDFRWPKWGKELIDPELSDFLQFDEDLKFTKEEFHSMGVDGLSKSSIVESVHWGEWQRVGTIRPSQGEEFWNGRMVAALAGESAPGLFSGVPKTTFTHRELKALGVAAPGSRWQHIGSEQPKAGTRINKNSKLVEKLQDPGFWSGDEVGDEAITIEFSAMGKDEDLAWEFEFLDLGKPQKYTHPPYVYPHGRTPATGGKNSYRVVRISKLSYNSYVEVKEETKVKFFKPVAFDLRMDSFIEAGATGLRWRNIGPKRPRHGVELQNSRLAEELKDKTIAGPSGLEWENMGTKKPTMISALLWRLAGEHNKYYYSRVTKTQYESLGKHRPENGEELKNPKLAKALMHKTEFTQGEWDNFGINEDKLHPDVFIKSGEYYFQPTILRRDLTNIYEKLANKLAQTSTQEKVTISKKERGELGISKLRYDVSSTYSLKYNMPLFDFIKAGDNYFRPAPPTASEKERASEWSGVEKLQQLHLFVVPGKTEFTQKEWNDFGIASGTRWHNIGGEKPKEGTELINPKLSQALVDDDDGIFSEEQWVEFGIPGMRNVDEVWTAEFPATKEALEKDPILRNDSFIRGSGDYVTDGGRAGAYFVPSASGLRADHYIKVGDSYFQPAGGFFFQPKERSFFAPVLRDFDEDEWREFDVPYLRMGHFIESEGSYFKPSKPEWGLRKGADDLAHAYDLTLCDPAKLGAKFALMQRESACWRQWQAIDRVSPGLEWKEVGSDQPTTGTEIHNRKLVEALHEKISSRQELKFSSDQWENFRVPRLSYNSYIKVDGKYFSPAGLEPPKGSLQKHSQLSEQLRMMCKNAAVGSKTHEFKEDEWAKFGIFGLRIDHFYAAEGNNFGHVWQEIKNRGADNFGYEWKEINDQGLAKALQNHSVLTKKEFETMGITDLSLGSYIKVGESSYAPAPTYFRPKRLMFQLGRDLSWMDLSDFHCTGLDFTGSNLYNARLVDTKLDACNLSDTKMDKAVLQQGYTPGTPSTQPSKTASMQLAIFSNTKLRSAELQGVNMEGQTLGLAWQCVGPGKPKGKELEQGVGRNDLLAKKLQKFKGQDGKFTSADWKVFKIKGLVMDNFIKVDRKKGPVYYMPVMQEQIKNLVSSDFDGAKMQGANLTETKLPKATFVEAKLQNSCFMGAVVPSGNFGAADLTDTNFEDATLDGASFVNGIITGVLFDGASLAKVQWSGAKNTDQLKPFTTTNSNRSRSDCRFDFYVLPTRPNKEGSAADILKKQAGGLAAGVGKMFGGGDSDDGDDGEDEEEDEENGEGEDEEDEEDEDLLSSFMNSKMAKMMKMLSKMRDKAMEFCGEMTGKFDETFQQKVELLKDKALAIENFKAEFAALKKGQNATAGKKRTDVQLELAKKKELVSKLLKTELDKFVDDLLQTGLPEVLSAVVESFSTTVDQAAGDGGGGDDEGEDDEDADADADADADEDADFKLPGVAELLQSLKGVLEKELKIVLSAMMKKATDELVAASLTKFVASVDARIEGISPGPMPGPFVSGKSFGTRQRMVSGTGFGSPAANMNGGAAGKAAAKVPDFDDLLDKIFKSLSEMSVDGIQNRVFASVNEKAMSALNRFPAAMKATLTAKYDASAASSLEKMPLSDGARKKMAKMSSVKGAMMSAALKAKSKYDPGKGIIKTLNLWQGALTRSALELNADEKELRFLLEKLQALEGCAFTEETWRDSLASWLAMLKLYKVLKVDSGLKMMESMVSDDKLAGALGAAGGMVKLNGRLPASLLVKLNEGPATHIRTNLYKYVKRLEKDLNMISAIKEKQAAIAAVAISLTTSIGVGFATFASGLLLDMYKKGQSFKRNDILLLVGCVAALFTCVSLITMLFRKRASLQQQQTAQSPFKVKEKPKAPLLQRMSMQLTNMRTKVPKLSRRTRRRMMIVLALVAPLILFFLFFSFGDYTCITKQCISIGAVGGTNATVTESDICSPIMVGAPCADETSDGGTTGMSSDTCYQALGPFAEGVTECASWGEGKEFVTPECKTAVGSRVDAQCGSEEGDDTTDDNPNTEEEGDDTTDDD